MNQDNQIEIYARGLLMALQEVKGEDHEKVIENFADELARQNHLEFFDQIETRLVELLEEQQKNHHFKDDQGVVDKLNNYAKDNKLDKHVGESKGIIWQSK